MSYCAVPDKVTKTSRPTTPAHLTLGPPSETGEVCDTSVTTVTQGGGGTPIETETVVAGPPGPPGPPGPGHDGIYWAGVWQSSKDYKANAKDTPQHASVVSKDQALFVCIQDHTSSDANAPQRSDYAGDPEPPDDILYMGSWTLGQNYFKFDGASVRANVVRIGNRYYKCKEDHTSTYMNQPQAPDFTGPSDWTTYWDVYEMPLSSGSLEWMNYWALMVEDTTGALQGEEKTFIENLKDGVFDWMKKATIGDWLKAIAIGAGIAYAGSKIIDHFTDDGSGTEDPDSRYNGSDSYTGSYTPPSVQEVVGSLCDAAGIENYDTSLLPGDVPCQFSLSAVTTARNILDQMSKTFQFDMVDSAGVLKFVPRNTTSVKSFTYDDLGYSSSTSDTRPPVTFKRIQSIDIPKSVSLTYIAEDIDYNNFTQKTENPTYVEGNDVTLQVPFMLEHDYAKKITDQILIGASFERQEYSFSTSYAEAIEIEPGDVVQIPDGFVRVTRIQEQDEGIIQITGVDAGAVGTPQPVYNGLGQLVGYTASTYIGTGQEPQLPAEVINPAPSIGQSGVLFIDPPVQNSADRQPRAYALVHGFGRAGWPGAQLFRSIDGGQSYSLIGSANKESTWGLVSLATPSADYHVWDNTTEIIVMLKTGTLVSKTDAAVLAGENRCMIGQEMIGFGSVQLIGTNTYKLTHLLRGRNGTEWAVGGHAANELFALLDDAPFVVEVPNSDRAKTYLYKVVTYGSDLTKVDENELQIIGENTLPWTPVNIKYEMIVSDWQLSWTGRPRFQNVLQDYYEVQNDFDFGGYVVTIYDGITVKRTIPVFDTKATYTEAQMIEDFGSVQHNLKIGICQVSNLFGGGRQQIVNT